MFREKYSDSVLKYLYTKAESETRFHGFYVAELL
jgi:hypothetical protein